MLVFLLGVTVFLCACGKKEDSRFKELKDIPDTSEPEGPLSFPLQTNDLKVGTGESAQQGDTVLIHYTGWLYENGSRGKQFDTSRDGNLFEVKIGETEMLKGITRGLMGMKVGGVRQMIIPPELAYGKAGRGQVIPPSSALEFEIEVFGLLKAPPTDAPTAGEEPRR
jgi:FKBP-type peptidyl-prolyl cis-trans isomerases 1